MAFDEIAFQVSVLFQSAERILQNVIGRSNYITARQYALNHPFIFIALLSVVIFSSVPMIFFLGFIITTLTIALICFFCIEGSLIAISSLIFIGVVCFISVIVGAILSGMAVTFWFLQKVKVCLLSCSSTLKLHANENPIIENSDTNHVSDTE